MSGADKDISGYIIDPTTRKVNMPAFRMLKAQSSLLNARAPITSLLLKVVANYGADEQLDQKTTERLNNIFAKALAKANAKFDKKGGFTFGPDSSVGDKVRGSSDAADTEFLEDLIRQAQMSFIAAAQTGTPKERAELRDKQDALMAEFTKKTRQGSSAEPVAKQSSSSLASQASSGSLGSSKQDLGRGLGLLRAAARAMTGTTRKGSSAGSADPEKTARDMDKIKDAAAAAAKLAARAGSPATAQSPVQTPAADRAARLAAQAAAAREEAAANAAAAAAKPKPRTPPPGSKRTPGGG